VSQTKTFVNNKTTFVKNEITELPNALIPIAGNEPEIKIFPLPAKDYFTLEINIESATNLCVDVCDLTGRLMKNIYLQQVSPGKHSLEFVTGELSAGNYLLRIKEGKGVYVKKLLINR